MPTYSGRVDVQDSNGELRIVLNGDKAKITAGGDGSDGTLIFYRNDATQEQLHDETHSTVWIDGRTGNLLLGGNGTDGDLVLWGPESSGGDFARFSKARMHLNAGSGNARLGGNGADGDLRLYRESASEDETGDPDHATVRLDGDHANVKLGGNGADGDLYLYGRVTNAPDTSLAHTARLHLDGDSASLRVGGSGGDGEVRIYGADQSGDELTDPDEAKILLDGNRGDIRLESGDIAEEFTAADGAPVEAGSVVVALGRDRVEPCSRSGDHRLLGVVAGAGRYRPALVLDHRPKLDDRLAVTLIGKAECKVDASFGPIRVGDLLIASETPGHARRAPASPAQGTVLGKALSGLENGRGLIPVLVNLQ